MTAEFLITSIIVVLLPGTGVLYTLAIGLGQGARASVFAAIGCTLGIVPHIMASIVGLAAILHASALAFQAIKYLGVIYLFYMAWTILRSGGALDVGEERRRLAPRKIVTSGIALNVLNPKLSLFFLAFLPQFADPAIGPVWQQILILGTLLAFGELATYCLLGGFAGLAAARIQRASGWLGKLSAIVFGGLALRLAWN